MTDDFDEDVRWTDVGAAADWEDKSGKRVEIGARRIGVYRDGERFFALKDVCPHRGLPMADDGRVENGCAVCPHHDWEFDLETGEGPGGCGVSTWPVRVSQGRVEVGV